MIYFQHSCVYNLNFFQNKFYVFWLSVILDGTSTYLECNWKLNKLFDFDIREKTIEIILRTLILQSAVQEINVSWKMERDGSDQ